MLRIDGDADLYTTMIVYPAGVGVMPDFLFTSATNRTQRSAEVVGMYNPSTPGQGDLGIFDWSCMSGFACSSGDEAPAWQWIRPLADLPCDIAIAHDDDGHQHETVYYVNGSHRMESGASPLWVNQVSLWNHCDDAWDLVYSHEFRVQQKDCSQDGQCGWWGPIVETFAANPQPEIPELGFLGSLLLHDGVWSSMRDDETAWSPPLAPWSVFHLDPNRGWGVGTTLPASDFDKTSPVDGAMGQPATGLTLQWGTSTNAVSYEYCLDTVRNSTCDTGWTSVNSATAADLPGLAAGTTFYWQARARTDVVTTQANGGRWWQFATEPGAPLTLTLTADRPAPQRPGTAVTFTASAAGGVAPYQFKWWLYDGAQWSVAQTWSLSPTLVWTPAAANAGYVVSIWARSAGNTADAAERAAGTLFPILGSVIASATVSADRPAPQPPGTTVTFTAAAAGGVPPYQFKWWLFDGTQWTVAQTWSLSATFAWRPATASPDYVVAVWVRSAGNTADAAERAAGTLFPILGSVIATATVASDRPAPQPPGTTVTFTATAAGGVPPYQFKWWLFDGTQWTVARTWSSSATFAWKPATASADYVVAVWVRSAGNTADAAERAAGTVFPILGSGIATATLSADRPTGQ